MSDAAPTDGVPLSTLLDRIERVDDELVLAVPPDWMQGRSVFGGVQAAVLLAAMRREVPERALRTLQVTFVAPTTGPLRATARTLRTGGSATHVEARLVDGPATVAVAVGVFGAARPSAAARALVLPPTAAPLEPPVEIRYRPGLTAAFLQHVRARWLGGQPPFTRYTGARHRVELELIDPAPIGEAHVVALADVMPPLALTLLGAPTPSSSSTWMLQILPERVDRIGPGPWQADAELDFAADGYTGQSLTLWAPDGTPVAMGRQSMLVFG